MIEVTSQLGFTSRVFVAAVAQACFFVVLLVSSNYLQSLHRVQVLGGQPLMVDGKQLHVLREDIPLSRAAASWQEI
jgi:hypothetical protein